MASPENYSAFILRSHQLRLQVTGTRRWLRVLDLPVVTTWRPWKSATGQVGGYFQRYKGLTLATVRDAGHMVRSPPAPLFYLLLLLFSKIAASTSRLKLRLSCPCGGCKVATVSKQVPYTQPERANFLFTNWITKSVNTTSEDSFY